MLDAKLPIRILPALNQRQSCGRVLFPKHHVAFPPQTPDGATKRPVEIATTDRSESTTSALLTSNIAGWKGGCRKSGGHQSRGQVRQRRVSLNNAEPAKPRTCVLQPAIPSSNRRSVGAGSASRRVTSIPNSDRKDHAIT